MLIRHAHTQRWGILRSAMPKNLSLDKINALVLTAARLHNFCLVVGQVIEPMNAEDEDNLEATGVVPLEHIKHIDGLDRGLHGLGQLVPSDLIGGGEHFDGVDRNERRRQLRLETMRTTIILPREQLCAAVLAGKYQRPTPRGRRVS